MKLQKTPHVVEVEVVEVVVEVEVEVEVVEVDYGERGATPSAHQTVPNYTN